VRSRIIPLPGGITSCPEISPLALSNNHNDLTFFDEIPSRARVWLIVAKDVSTSCWLYNCSWISSRYMSGVCSSKASMNYAENTPQE